VVRAIHNEVHELHYSIRWVDLVPFVDDAATLRRCDAATLRACCGSGSGPQAAAATAAHVAAAPAIEYAAAWCLGQTVAAAAEDTAVATAEIARRYTGAAAEDVRGRSGTVRKCQTQSGSVDSVVMFASGSQERKGKVRGI
jgi:hypothetical protein